MKMTTAYPKNNPDPKSYKKFKDCSELEKQEVLIFTLEKPDRWPLEKTWWSFHPSRKDKSKLAASAYGGTLCL